MSKDVKKCPVCSGRGKVRFDFYESPDDPYSRWRAILPEPDISYRSCLGRGIIIIEDSTTYIVPKITA